MRTGSEKGRHQAQGAVLGNSEPEGVSHLPVWVLPAPATILPLGSDTGLGVVAPGLEFACAAPPAPTALPEQHAQAFQG